MYKFNTLRLAVVAALTMGSLSAIAATEIKIAFNQSDNHPQYEALEIFGKQVAEQTDGRYEVKIFPNELLGDQRAALELLQNGAIQMATVAAPLVENYDKTFRVIGMPFIYASPEHQRKVFTSDTLNDLFASTSKYGFEVLAAYTAGARSVYNKGAPVETVPDMDGKKVRVMQSDTMVKMLDCLGGTGVPMSQGEVYTAIQQGILDGAENNEITYADLKHYEVAPYFSTTRHLMVPDLLIASEPFLQSMSDEDRQTVKRLAKESVTNEFDLWDKQIASARKEAEEHGATFTDIDNAPFEQNCRALQKSLVETPQEQALYDQIQALK